MGSEAPEGVFILAHLPQIHAQAIQIEHFAQVTRLHHIPKLFDSGMIHQQMAGDATITASTAPSSWATSAVTSAVGYCREMRSRTLASVSQTAASSASG